MSGIKKLLSHSAIYGLSSIIGRLLNWALTPIYANHLSRATFGIFSDLYALSFFPQVILTFGLETAFFHYTARESNTVKERYTQGFITMLSFAVLFFLLGQIFALPLAKVLGYESEPNYIRLLVAVITFDVCAALPMAKLRYDEKAKRYAFISLTNIAVTLLLNIYFIVLKNGTLQDIFWANLIASAIRFVMALYQNLPQNIAAVTLTKVVELLNYGQWIMYAGLAGAINETLDRSLLPRLWIDGNLYKGIAYTGAELNGIYSANYKLGMFIALVTQAYRYAAEPLFFRHAQSKDSPPFFAKTFHYFVTACLLAFLWVSAFSYQIVTFNAWGLWKAQILPESYLVGLEAVPCILFANVCLGAYMNVSIWYKVTNQPRYGLYFALAGAVLTLFINCFFIPVYGYMACAWATVSCYGLMLTLACIWGQRDYPVPYPFARLLVYALLCVTLVTAIYLLDLQKHSWFNFFLCLLTTVGILFYEKRNRAV